MIEELRADGAGRRRFLAACGVEGAILALSHAGGPSGERLLPLLVDDADWDQLGDRLHPLARELEDQSLARVLFALGDTLAAVGSRAHAVEAQILAVHLLGDARRRWDGQRRPLPVFLLEAWHTLNAAISEPMAPPRPEPTWAELHPGSALLLHPDRSELVRADEWLALAQMLARHDRRALARLRFYDRDRDLLAELIVVLSRACADEELRDLSESVLSRVEALVPALATGAHGAIEIGRLAEGLASRRWWVPEDIAAPPTTEPVTASPRGLRREDVTRVMSDL